MIIYCRCDNEQSNIPNSNVNQSVSRENTITDSMNVGTSEPDYAPVTINPSNCDARVDASKVKTKMDVDPAYHQKRN